MHITLKNAELLKNSDFSSLKMVSM